VVERIGLTQARRLALLGLRIDANEACRLGIAHQAASSDDELEDMLGSALDRVRRCAPVATAETKALLHRVGHEPMSGLLDSAAEKFAEAGAAKEQRAPWLSCKSGSQRGQANRTDAERG
jgi:isohexenylglutaconyl-CoA hydratase